MKFLMMLLLLTNFISCNEKKEVESQVQTGAAQSELPKELEDCDDKAKKVEINPEEIKLQGGDAGCSLDEAQSNK
jgi:hypothetical protein